MIDQCISFTFTYYQIFLYGSPISGNLHKKIDNEEL